MAKNIVITAEQKLTDDEIEHYWQWTLTIDGELISTIDVDFITDVQREVNATFEKLFEGDSIRYIPPQEDKKEYHPH